MMPSVRFILRNDKKILNRIKWIANYELVSSHLYFNQLYIELLKKNCIIYFIYRDPRDVAISEAYYLTYMNHWHRAHHFFSKKLKNNFDRILFSITGIPKSEVTFDFPNIADRFKPYSGWISSPNAFSIRYEDLISPNREQFILAMIDFFVERTNININKDELLIKILHNINPQKSHTFRSGKSGSWKNEFSQKHIDVFKQIAGDLLIELGYEKDLDW